MSNLIAGMDIGTSKVSVVLGKIDVNGIQVMGVGISPNNGMKKGVIVDIDSTARAIEQAVEQLQNMANIDIDSVYINISGGHASLFKNRGVIAVTKEDREITGDDVRRVIQSAKVFALPPDKEIIDVIPRQFIVDGYDEIRDPVGMFGTRLEVDASIVACNSTTLQNLVRSVTRTGLEIDGVVLEPFAISEVLLTPDEKELGVVIIDVGAGKTEYSIFENGILKSSAIIPVGGDNITNDLAVGLRVSFNEAENLKKEHGYAMASLLEEDLNIRVNSIGEEAARDISTQEFIDIIEARVYEIFFLINRELMKQGVKPGLSAGAVITGGGVSFLKGSKEIAQQVLGLPVRIGTPEKAGITSLAYSSGFGIIKYVAGRRYFYQTEEESKAKKTGLFGKQKSRQGQKGNMMDKLKDFFDEYF